MNKPLKILHLEDLSNDATLVARKVKKAGIDAEIVVVANKTDFITALKKISPDIILSDHSLPSFNSREALTIVKEMKVEAPFILVTATVSEDYAVSMMKDGASDYILKDRLQRLPNAILGALEKHAAKAARKMADEALRASERKYKLLFLDNPIPMWIICKGDLRIIAVNKAAINQYGYSKDEFLTLNAKDLRPPEDIEKFLSRVKQSATRTIHQGVWRHKKKDGTNLMVDIIAHDLLYENRLARLVLANDVTEKINAEAELAQQKMVQQKLITETSLKVQENEREEIGKELHDNINQILVTVRLYLDHMIAIKEFHPELLQNCLGNIDHAIHETRKLSHAFVAPSLDDTTLVQVIERLLKEIRHATSLHGQLIIKNYAEDALDNDRKLAFYRIIQEQINNTVKHAGAKNIVIQLSISAGQILLSITDDGNGFDTRKKAEGIGLRNIRHRVGFYDGSVQIISAPGKGCKLEVSIPVVNVF